MINKTSRRFSRLPLSPLPCSLSPLSFSFALPLLSFHGRNFPRLSTSGRRPLRPLWPLPGRVYLLLFSLPPSLPPSPPSRGISTLILRLSRAFCTLLFAYPLRRPANVSLARWPFFLRGASFNLETRSSATVARVTTSSSMMMMVMTTTIIIYVSSLLLLL